MNITTIGLGIAKNVFQLHGVDANGKTVLHKQIKRNQVPAFFANLPCLIGLEACSGAHYPTCIEDAENELTMAARTVFADLQLQL